MNIFFLSCAGKYHTALNMANEDCIATRKNDNLVVSAITDGAGGKTAGKEAAQILAPIMADWMFNTFLDQYYRCGDIVRREVVEIVSKNLKQYARTNGIDETDLACTLMVSAMDSDGHCLCIHLGDGVILRQNTGYDKIRADIVSAPENGLTRNTTFLTMNCNMWQHIRYCRWKDPNTEYIIMLTDGAQTHIVDLSKTNGWSVIASCQLDAAHISERLASQYPEDDYSIAIISQNHRHPNPQML